MEQEEELEQIEEIVRRRLEEDRFKHLDELYGEEDINLQQEDSEIEFDFKIKESIVFIMYKEVEEWMNKNKEEVEKWIKKNGKGLSFELLI